MLSGAPSPWVGTGRVDSPAPSGTTPPLDGSHPPLLLGSASDPGSALQPGILLGLVRHIPVYNSYF